jgi:hypothetical protein
MERVPSAWWHVVAMVVPLALGISLSINSCGRIIAELEDRTRIVVPGGQEIPFDAGDYTVYLEDLSLVDGVVYAGAPDNLRCRVEDVATHEEVPLESGGGTERYTLGSYSGRSIFDLTIRRPATYLFACEGTGGPGVVAIGEGLGSHIILLVASILGTVFGTIVINLGVAIWRHRIRRRVMQAAKQTTPV